MYSHGKMVDGYDKCNNKANNIVSTSANEELNVEVNESNTREITDLQHDFENFFSLRLSLLYLL